MTNTLQHFWSCMIEVRADKLMKFGFLQGFGEDISSIAVRGST